MTLQRIDFNFSIFEKTINLDKEFIEHIKSEELRQYEFNKNNYLLKENYLLTTTVKNQIDPLLQEIGKALNFAEYTFTKTWVQKYNKNHFHDCHIHSFTDYSFIIYVECTEDSSETMFYNIGYPYVDTLRHRVKPKIGKCVVFHGMIPHSVLPNKDDERLIVSGNIQWKK
jgi:hypothetical protein